MTPSISLTKQPVTIGVGGIGAGNLSIWDTGNWDTGLWDSNGTGSSGTPPTIGLNSLLFSIGVTRSFQGIRVSTVTLSIEVDP